MSAEKRPQINLPSYSKFTENQDAITDAERKLYDLQLEKRSLQSEYDKIPSARAKTASQRNRRDELEWRLEEIS